MHFIQNSSSEEKEDFDQDHEEVNFDLDKKQLIFIDVGIDSEFIDLEFVSFQARVRFFLFNKDFDFSFIVIDHRYDIFLILKKIS